MDFDDGSDTQDPNPGGGEQMKAAPGSVLMSLRQRRDAVRKHLQLDLRVPRLDPAVYVRFRPATQAVLDAVEQRAALARDRDKNATVRANAAVLVESCIGVFQLDAGGREVSVDVDDLEGDWPKFDAQLGELLGLKAGGAVEVVRALYATDGDIVAACNRLITWSGQSSEQLEKSAEEN